MTQLETYLNSLQRFGIRPGLERIRELLARVGNPQSRYPIVLVGGTNGKGSTVEFLARLLADDGLRVGLFTSPHLYKWNERIRILPENKSELETRNPELFAGSISDVDLDALFFEALPHIEAVAQDERWGQPTEFEVLTLLGFLHFARTDVDVAVIEVGLGGKWDATNVCEPTVSVITHVALDHCDRLGNTLEEIAADKAHIARADRVLVTAETKAEVLRVLRQHCEAVDCRLQIADCGLNTDFQQTNLQTAQLARRVLCETLFWPINLLSTIQNPQLAGRFETIRENPRVILDGANNPDGASTLSHQLQELLKEKPEAKLILVLGIFADKDYAAMIQVLAPLAETVIATRSSSSRACSGATIAKISKEHCPNVEMSTPPQTALNRALELAKESDIICVTGSFFTIAEIGR